MGGSSEQEPPKQRYPWGHWEGFEGGIWGSLGDRNPSRSRDSVGAGPVGPTTITSHASYLDQIRKTEEALQ